MNNDEFDSWLEREAGALPKSIDPGRDLWPAIEGRLRAEARATHAAHDHGASRIWPFLSGIAATLLVAFAVTRLQPPAAPATDSGDAPVLLVERPAAWVPEVTRARNQLHPGFENGLRSLPPETRRLVEENLQQIHRSLAQIHEALAADPGNLALHRMLAGTYRQEINLISNIGALTESETQL